MTRDHTWVLSTGRVVRMSTQQMLSSARRTVRQRRIRADVRSIVESIRAMMRAPATSEEGEQ